MKCRKIGTVVSVEHWQKSCSSRLEHIFSALLQLLLLPGIGMSVGILRSTFS